VTEPAGDERRWYIGLFGGMRMSVALGPGTFRVPPGQPLPLDDQTLLYPVSQDIATEWGSTDGEAWDPEQAE